MTNPYRLTFFLLLLLTASFQSVAAQSKGTTQLVLSGGIADLGSKEAFFETKGSSFALYLKRSTSEFGPRIYGFASVGFDRYQFISFSQGAGSSSRNGVPQPVITHTTRGKFYASGGNIGIGKRLGRMSIQAHLGLAYIVHVSYTKIEIQHIGPEIISKDSPYRDLNYGETVTSADNSFNLSPGNKRLEENLGIGITYSLTDDWSIGTQLIWFQPFFQSDQVESDNARFSNSPIREVGRFTGDDFYRQRTSLRIALHYFL